MQGIATLPYEVTEQPNYPTGGINSIKHAADMMADFGRHGDTYIVHAAEGETVLPMEVLEANPRMKRMIHQQMEEMGLDPQRYIVGTEYNSINPVTGRPEFFFKKIGRALKKGIKGIKKIAKKLAPIVLPIAAPFMFPLMPVAFSAGIGSLVGGMASGMKFKDALKSAAITAATAGAGQAVRNKGWLGSMSGTKQTLGEGLKSMVDPGTYQFQNPVKTFSTLPQVQKTNQQVLEQQTNPVNAYGPRDQASGRFKVGLVGEQAKLGGLEAGGAGAGGAGAGGAGAGGVKEPSFYQKYFAPDRFETTNLTAENIPQYEADALARTKASADAYAATTGETMSKEAFDTALQKNIEAVRPGAFVRQAPRAALIATGIGLADKKLNTNLIFPANVDEGTQVALGPSGEELYAQDPGKYGFDFNLYKGRNPYYTMTAQEGGEIVGPGTGTSDSIPALLSDGEFVVTAKAVRNAGGGDRRAGAQRMYNMMKRLEQGGTA